MAKWVYKFEEGSAAMRNLLGGKGCNLARISRNDNVLHIMSELGDQLIRTSVLSVRYGDFSLDTYCSNHSRLLECLKNHEYQKGREELEQHISVWEGHLKKVPEILQINSDENLVF